MSAPARSEAPRRLLRIVPPVPDRRSPGAPGRPPSWVEHAVGQLLRLHRELMAERDETLRLTQEVGATRHALEAFQSYAEALEAEVRRLQSPPAAAAPPDVEGWR